MEGDAKKYVVFSPHRPLRACEARVLHTQGSSFASRLPKTTVLQSKKLTEEQFFLYTNGFYCFCLVILRTLRLFKLKTEGPTTETENLTIKLQNSNQKFSLILN